MRKGIYQAMKTKFLLLLRWLLVLSVAIGFMAPPGSVEAAFTSTSSASPPPQTPPPQDENVLILLPYSAPQPQELALFRKTASRHEWLADTVYARTKPLQAELRQLQEQGLIGGFEVRPEWYGVVVHGLSQEAARRLQALPGIAGVFPESAEAKTCAEATASALVQQSEALRQSLERRAAMQAAGDLTAQATNPSIEVSYYSDGYGWVDGSTFPNVTVTLRILRGSTVVATDTTTSDSDGWYYFWPDWLNCPTSGYTWSLQPGDVVEVSAGGRTVSTVVAYLVGWADPQTDRVSGRTDPGRTVEINLWYYPDSPCSGYEVEKTLSADGNGNFTADMGVDFDGWAGGIITARDANGNGTYRYFSAYYLEVDTRWNEIYFYLQPGVSYVATLKRGGSTLETYSGTTNPYEGDAWVYFGGDFQPDDVLEVSGGGVSLQYTIAPLTNITLDPAANQVSGNTAASRRVRGYFRKSTYYDIITACDWDNACTSVVSDDSGAFTLNPAWNLVRGDSVGLHLLDSQGNAQYHFLRVPVIGVDLSNPGQQPEVRVAWSTSTVLTITHLNWGGSVVNTYSIGVYPHWGNEGWSYLNEPVYPGDRIRVSDGSTSLEMSLPDPLPTASLKNNLQRLVVTNAPSNSYLLAELYDFRFEDYNSYYYCRESSLSGSINLQFGDAKIGGWDLANAWIRLPEEHLIRIQRRPFMVNHWIGSPVIDITYEFGRVVTVKRWRGSTLLDNMTINPISEFTGVLFSSEVLKGDRLVITTDDGQSADLTVPELTINLDKANNRIYGKSVPNRPIAVQLQRWVRGYYVLNRFVNADSAGNYSATFNGLNWWDCSPARLDHRCAAGGIDYATADGHVFQLDSPSPSPAPTDAYEDDNDRSRASAYAGIQTHTFHVESDEDWVSFTVPPQDVDNVIYRIATLNEGWEVDTVIDLYDAGGTHILTGYGWWDGVYWIPPAAGTYYVKVSPYSDYSTAHCDAYYDLLVLPIRAEVYLPLVRR